MLGLYPKSTPKLSFKNIIKTIFILTCRRRTILELIFLKNIFKYIKYKILDLKSCLLYASCFHENTEIKCKVFFELMSVFFSFLIEDWTGKMLLFGLHSKEKWWAARRRHIPVTDRWWVLQFAFRSR